MYDAPQMHGRFCASPELAPSRTTCRGYDFAGKHPAYVDGNHVFCNPCTAGYSRGIRMLPYDYLDLEQLQAPSLSQAMDAQPGSRKAPPMPMAAAPEALQAEIRYVLTLWEYELRLRLRMLHSTTVIVGAWHTTASNPPPPPKVRPGLEVQRAAEFLAQRINTLARIEPITVYPSGCDDPPTDMAGADAVLHLSNLHRRARSMLGRTHRTTTVPGSCSSCGGELWRDEPRYEQDPCDIYCNNCGVTWTYDEYDRYVGLQLLFPRRKCEVTA